MRTEQLRIQRHANLAARDDGDNEPECDLDEGKRHPRNDLIDEGRHEHRSEQEQTEGQSFHLYGTSG